MNYLTKNNFFLLLLLFVDYFLDFITLILMTYGLMKFQLFGFQIQIFHL